MLVYQNITRRHNPEDLDLNLDLHEDLESRKLVVTQLAKNCPSFIEPDEPIDRPPDVFL
jgi:hypothetical protein